MIASEDRRIRALRSTRPHVDPWQPIGWQHEIEWRDGVGEQALTIFLAGAECPFTCVFCDLWRYTTDAPTPAGAIPRQIRIAFESFGQTEDPTAAVDVVKLYNASNFFDRRAVPLADDPAILDTVAHCSRVVVECHPKLVGRRAFDFAERLVGRLEVAMGFETAHPEALARLNKRVDLDDLRRAARALRDRDIGVRAFVLIGAPFVPLAEELEWLERSVVFALEHGAELVSLIPVRGGEGELARLEAEGSFEPPDLDRVEAAFEHCRQLSDRIRLDTWDLDRFAEIDGTGGAPPSARIERLERLGSGRPKLVPSAAEAAS